MVSLRWIGNTVTAVVAATLTVVGGNDLLAQAVRQGPSRADALVSAALKAATAEHKVVLIEFGASWCTWCKSFDAFVHAPEVASIVANNYLVLNLTVHERDDKKGLENPGGEDIMNNWGGAKSGLPFYVFLDQAGKKIADSNAMPDGTNVGFPGNAKELQVFLGLLDKTAPHLNKVERGKIVDHLNKTVKP
jgi:thiol:disulfide interchange protein